MGIDDIEIYRKIIRGDESGLSLLIEKYTPLVLHIINQYSNLHLSYEDKEEKPLPRAGHRNYEGSDSGAYYSAIDRNECHEPCECAYRGSVGKAQHHHAGKAQHAYDKRFSELGGYEA